MVLTLCFGLELSFSPSAWCQSNGPGRQKKFVGGWNSLGRTRPQGWVVGAKNNDKWTRISKKGSDKRSSQEEERGEKKPRKYHRLPHVKQERLRSKYKQWRSLSPEKRQELRRRMQRWKELSPEERRILRKRHKQWQSISPDERRTIRKKLEMWDKLTPQEREKIRQKFRNP
jgi:hypothetical protein